MKYMYYICRMLKNIKSLAVLLLSLCSIGTMAQEREEKQEKFDLMFEVYDQSFFDNREVRTPNQRSQTLFGSMLSVEGGVKFGPHTIMAGVHGIKDFGAGGLTTVSYTHLTLPTMAVV